MHTRRTLFAALMALLPMVAAAQSQTVWRCGADGRSYSNVPCTEGLALDAVAARPSADVQAAQDVAQRERRLADTMRKDRLREEVLAQRSGAAGIYAGAPTGAVTTRTAAKAPEKARAHTLRQQPPKKPAKKPKAA